MPERDLSRLTSPQVRQLEKDPGVVVLPIGAVEQHGPHLPAGTDFLIADRIVQDALNLLARDAPVWSLPCMPYGKSTEHEGWPGTISLSAPTLMAFLQDVGRSLAVSGFRRLAFLNGHGGNAALLSMLARDIRAQSGLLVFTINPSYATAAPFEIPEKERELGLHGGLVETSLMQALAPELVDMQAAKAEYPDLPPSESGNFFYGRTSMGWLSKDWSASGLFGDPAGSSSEKGDALLAALARQVADVLLEISQFDVPSPAL
jgi:creatinine amidohydrolase/Fe(II)-dependent formamide hydrolase-like protein